jgi:hypothetical protein
LNLAHAIDPSRIVRFDNRLFPTVIQERVFSPGNSSSSAEPRLTAFSKATRAALWTSIASNIGSARNALAAFAGTATAAVAAAAAAVERKPRRVVLVELVIDFLALPKVEGFDGRSRADVDASARFSFYCG